MKRSMIHRSIALTIVLLLVCSTVSISSAQMQTFVETFNDPALPGWEHTPDVTVENGRLYIPASSAAFHQGRWRDLAFSVWVRRSGEGALSIHYLATMVDTYSVVIDNETITLEPGGESAAFSVPDGTWFQLSVSAMGETHTVAVNGEEVLALAVATPGAPGSIGFETGGDVVGEFDDLIVIAPGGAPPPDRPGAPPSAGDDAPPPSSPVLPPPPSIDISADCTQDITPGALQAAADAAQPGDVVCLGGGDYSAEGEITLAVSGTAEAPIAFTTGGEAATIHGLTLAQGTSHLRLQGFTVQGFEVWGVTLAGNNEDVLIAGMNISGGEAGIRLTYQDQTPVNNITIVDTIISNTVYTAIDCTPGPCNNMRFHRLEIFGAGQGDANYGADGLSVGMGAHILVEDCYIHDNSGDGIDLNSRDAGGMPGIVVRRNRVGNNMLNGIKLWNGGAAINNVVWNSGTTLLVLEAGDYTIAYNTFASMSSHDYLAVLGGYETSALSNIRLYNNIFYNDNAAMDGTLVYFAPGVQLEADNNLYYNPYREEDIICAEFLSGGETCLSRDEIVSGGWFTRSGHGEHSIFYADPLFVDAANGDFSLSAGSPAIDVGTPNIIPPDDVMRNPRPAGDGPDLGGYEMQ